MNGEDKILDEITQGGLPSNVRVEIVAEAPPLELAPWPAEPALPAVCGQNYVANNHVFPEKCSLPAGHKPKSSTANHFCFGIGWWA